MPGAAGRLPKAIDGESDAWWLLRGSGTAPGGPGSRAAAVQVPSSATDICRHLMKAVPCARARNWISGAGAVLLPSCRGILETARGHFGGSTAEIQARSVQLGCLSEQVCPFCWCMAVVMTQHPCVKPGSGFLTYGSAGQGAADL